MHGLEVLYKKEDVLLSQFWWEINLMKARELVKPEDTQLEMLVMPHVSEEISTLETELWNSCIYVWHLSHFRIGNRNIC